MKTVFVLHHVHTFDDEEEDVKLLGIFSSEEKAWEAIAVLSTQPGFSEHPDGFEFGEYTLDKIYWEEGFITV